MKLLEARIYLRLMCVSFGVPSERPHELWNCSYLDQVGGSWYQMLLGSEAQGGWSQVGTRKTSAGTRPEGQGEDGSGKCVMWELAEVQRVVFSLSEHSSWIEREGFGLSSWCDAQGMGQRHCGCFASKDPSPAPHSSKDCNVCWINAQMKIKKDAAAIIKHIKTPHA